MLTILYLEYFIRFNFPYISGYMSREKTTFIIKICNNSQYYFGHHMYDITLDENMKDSIFFPAQSKPLVEVRLKQAFL